MMVAHRIIYLGLVLLMPGAARAEWYLARLGPEWCVPVEKIAPDFQRTDAGRFTLPEQLIDTLLVKYAKIGARATLRDLSMVNNISEKDKSHMHAYVITAWDPKVRAINIVFFDDIRTCIRLMQTQVD